jgi:hypothetical protein
MLKTLLFRSIALIGALSLAVVSAPTALDAQAVGHGPRVATAGVPSAVFASPLVLPEALPLQDGYSGRGTSVAMMVVGGAAIVVGSVVGGDGGTIIGVAGAVVGLIGLFRYLR